MNYLKKIGRNSRKAFEKLKNTEHKKIKSVLEDYNRSLFKNMKLIIRANLKDVKKAKRKHLIDRLILNKNRINDIRKSINEIANYKNPVGKVLEKWNRPNKLNIKKISTSLGVIGVIYESRPNVTSDVASLCLKSGNCVILRGGSEAFHTNKILSDLFRKALSKNNIDKNCVQFIDRKDRKIVNYLLSGMNNFIDVIVPRGGKNLVKKVQKFSKVHTIGHLEGICHIYLDKASSFNMANKIVLNAKMRRTSICGAMETLLINEKLLKTFAKQIINSLIKCGCEVRVDKKINKLFNNKLKMAKEKDWSTEYLDSILSIKTVKNVHEATSHILKYGTMHTDSIVTRDKKTAKIFFNKVNSAITMQNVSTQFADGGEFGFGGEVGISTNKLPPRGPVGLNQLVSYKYQVISNGKTRK